MDPEEDIGRGGYTVDGPTLGKLAAFEVWNAKKNVPGFTEDGNINIKEDAASEIDMQEATETEAKETDTGQNEINVVPQEAEDRHLTARVEAWAVAWRKR